MFLLIITRSLGKSGGFVEELGAQNYCIHRVENITGY
jgi:hypothetical protein